MAAKLAEVQTVSRVEIQTGSEDEDEKIDEPKSEVPFQANQSSHIFNMLDKMLDKCQGLCRHVANQLLRDKECDNEITTIKTELRKHC